MPDASKSGTRNRRDAFDQVIRELHPELRRFVRSQFLRCDVSATLSATCVVHEIYIRLRNRGYDWRGKSHIRALAIKSAEQVLIDYARRRSSQKRGGLLRRVTFDERSAPAQPSPAVSLDLHAALQQLRSKRPKQWEVVNLRYMGGLSFKEIAKVMNIAPDTAREYWAYAKAWLSCRLSSVERSR